MNTINHSTRLILVGMMLLFILACNLSTSQPVAPVQVVAVVITETSVQASDTPSLSPTFPPTKFLVKTSTRTPTKTPPSTFTNTPLPPLPDFDQSLSFGGGGTGGVGEKCISQASQGYQVPAVCGITISDMWSSRTGSARQAELDLFRIPENTLLHLSLIPPSGNKVQEADLVLSYSAKTVTWNGGDTGTVFGNSNRGSEYFTIQLWWPGGLPPGTWQAQLTWNGGMAQGTFDAGVKSLPEISFVAQGKNGISANTCRVFPSLSTITVLGEVFSPGSQAQILMYEMTEWMQPSPLVVQQAVQCDNTGNFSTVMNWPFEPGKYYFLRGYDAGSGQYATWDCLQIASQLSGISSCPGAPPQRMTVNQRGYVCTRSDAVRVRVSPARSANTLVQIEPGTQFTVIGGPSCSDNWSWWNVRLDNGTTGWVSEGGDEVDPYFICPLP